MKVKKYTGYTTHEAMTKLKRELGSDAVVLNTRTVRQKGFLGIFKKPLVEITAAYEKKDLLSPKSREVDNLNKINNELTTLRNMVEQISSHVKERELEFPRELDKYRMKLIENGVEYITATSILKKLNEQIDFSNKNNNSIKMIIKQTLMEYIGQVKPLSLDNPSQKVIFFVGPTGVGKTTTLAKIAAQLVMEGEYDIGLITSDTYRIAAIDQLKTYSDILQLPLEIIYNEEDMYKTLVTFKDKDIIFVDTAGRNHKDIEEEDEIFKIMNSVKNREVFLVLSGTTEYSTLKSIIKHYDFIEDYKIIFTKIDECEGLGNILNTKYLTDNPVSYVTTGQNVPDDIEVLNKEKVVSSLIGEI